MGKYAEATAKEPSDAYLITEAQTALKEIVCDHVRRERPKFELKERCEVVVRNLKNRIKNDETRAVIDSSMEGFIRELYDHFSALFGALRIMAQIMKAQKVVNTLKKDGLPSDGIPLSQDPLSYNMSPGARDYFEAYQRDVRRELGKILAMQPRPSYEDRNINLRTIAEMNVRYEKQTKMIADLSSQGEDLVWIAPHANASKRCEPWQGKLYSISGRSGKTEDGVTFQPLSNATDVITHTTSGKAYKNGCVTGFGCRHKLEPHRPGKRPIMIPASVVEKQRAAEERQRDFERRIRYQKEKAAIVAAIDPEAAREARKKATALNKAYEAFSKASGMPVVPTRTRVMPGENIYKRNVAKLG